MEDTKNQLLIPPLKKVVDYYEDLDFLKRYGRQSNITQIRNSCQLLQLTELLRNINNNYRIYGGQWYLYLYNFMRISADCCEGLLYAFYVKQKGKPRGRMSLEDLINYAKSVHKPLPLLSKKSVEGLKDLLFFRNYLHPDKQIELHIKMIQRIEARRNELTSVHNSIITDMMRYFNVQS